MKYKVNEISPVGLSARIPQECREAEQLFGAYCKWYFQQAASLMGEDRGSLEREVVDWLTAHPTALTWALEEGIVERVEEEETYAVGDWFSPGSEDLYILSAAGTDHVSLICVDDGLTASGYGTRGGRYKVANPESVPAGVIDKMFSWDWKKIPTPKIKWSK